MSKDIIILILMPILGLLSLGTSFWLSGFCFGIVFWHLGYMYKTYKDNKDA